MAGQNPVQHLSSPNDEMPIHKFIPMEKLDFIESNQVKILYYQTPSRFYLYLRQNLNAHAQLQIDLQRAMQNHQSASLQYERYQPVVAQDNHAVWHRATILDFNPKSADVRVYFVDFGQEETLSKTNIRPLPSDFVRQPAFAIPCRLFDIYPRTRSDQSTWKSDDPVHDEFNRLMANTANCKVCKVIEQICYDVQIDIPKVGDLGAFLLEKNLVSRITMQTSQPTIYNTNQSQSFGRAPPGFSSVSSSVQPPQRLPSQNDYYSQPNHTVQQPQTLSLSKPVVQQTPSVPLSTDSSCDIRPLPLQDGTYVITQVYSAVEFYGYSDGREKELHALQKYFADIYNNNNTNDQSISVHLLMEGTACVIQHNDQFHRVVIQRRESESRVSVKLVDRGDEIIVDTSELLQLERKCLTVPAFAQPLRLYNYDKSHSTANITHKLKKLILNQRVQIIQHLPTIHGFYPVEVKLSDNQSVNQILLSNATIPINPPAPPPPPPPMRMPEIQTTKVQPEVNIQRTDDLPAPQKILTASQPGRTQPGRFSAASQPVVNDPTSRFSRPQQDEPIPRPTNGNQPLATEQSRTFSRGFTTNEDNVRVNNDEQRNGNTRGSVFADRAGRNGSSDRNFNRNNDDNENDNGGRRATRFDDRGGGFSGRGNRGGYNERNNYENRNENYGQQPSGFNNSGGDRFADRGRGGGGGFVDRGRGGGFVDRGRGGGFADRGRGGGFTDPGRGDGGGFADRGRGGGGGFADRGRGGGGGFADRGRGGGSGFADRDRGGGGGFADRARSGVSQDRLDGNRNNDNDGSTENSNPQRSQGFANRGDFHGDRERRNDGFSNYRGRGNDRYGGGGDSGHRGGYSDRGGQRGGRDGGRGGRDGDRGGRNGGFGDQENNGFGSTNENNDSKKTFSGWPNVRTPTKCFEAGDHFTEHEIPQESFEFVISHIEAADDFFIQSYSKAAELFQLTDRLQKESEVPLELNFKTLKINQPCLAKSSDGCWYRASVLSTDSNRTSVRFIDFGDTIDADAKTTQRLGKEFCLEPPYAYRCTLPDVEVNTTIDKNAIIARCEGKQFHGKIEKTLSDNKYLLQSDDLQKLLIELKAIKLKSNEKSKCVIVYIDQIEHQFYIQMDDETMDKIDEHVADAGELSIDEIQVGSMVILTFDGAPARAIVQEDLGENVQVYFVDYGNKHVCPKTSLRQYREELKSYPYQAQRCGLHNISSHDLNQAFTQLDGYLQSDQTEISIVHENTDVWSVRLYIDGECFNEKFPGEALTVEKNETSSETTSQSSATTVKEQERPTSATGKRNNEEILSPVGNSSSASSNIKRKKSESETEVNSTKYRTGTLTHIDKTQPIVYLQLIPDCESDLERINDFIDNIIVDNQHNSSYAVGDYVIAQFSEDYYRARVESYSSTTEQYTVYFLDYGNTDEVSLDHMLPCLDELKQIKAQTHKYSLENQTSQTWTTFVYPFLETKLNGVIEFYFSNDTQSSVHIKFDDNENQMYHQVKTYTANISGTNQDCFYIHIVPDADTLICEMDELLNTHSKEHRTSDQWQINDLSIVHDHDKEQYFRGKILSIDNDKYNVQCIDYGHILEDRSNDDLYVLSDDDLLKRTPIARQCRLFSVTNDNQIKAVEEVIKTIHANERVTVTLHSDHNDPCWSVMLFRQDNETVNDRYQSNDANQQKTDDVEQNDTLPDSAIGADDDTSNVDMPCRTPDQYLTSPIGVPQAESTHQYGDTANASVSNSSPSTSSMTINQTIDFGENDPSTSNTTLKDENENLSLN